MTVLHPPVPVAVATRARELPTDPDTWAFEPKYDGYRTLGFATQQLLQSRQGSTALTARFPEVLQDLVTLGDVVIDGELVALQHGHLVFSALQHGPQRRAREGTTAILVAFDLLAHDGQDLRVRSYLDRRAELAHLLTHPLPHLQLIESTHSPHAAREWLSPVWGAAGVEGVLAKPRSGRYRSGQGSGWLKIRTTVTTEAAIMGVVGADTLVLGGPDPSGRWRVRGLSQPLPQALRAELATRLHLDPNQPTAIRLPGTAGGLPGDPEITYYPTLIEIVVEIDVDTAIEYGRWRHRSQVLRIRDDLAADDLQYPG